MCGISLILSRKLDRPSVESRLVAVEETQRHRGPDAQGRFVDEFDGTMLGMGHQRLSILDLSTSGHQPMTSTCGRYIIAYNGEIYNFREIAAELGNDPNIAISSSDTAVVLAALIRWGPAAFRRFNGMWALAFFDRERRKILISRDRLGVKPLYYALDRNDLVMASEIKGVLRGCGGRRFLLNPDVVGRYLLQSLIAAQPETFFRGVESFPPASYAELNLRADRLSIEPVTFWKHPYEECGASRDVPTCDDVREIFLDSVRLRLRADVPVGIMLSGGVDSSAILSAARRASPSGNLLALSVVSRDPAANEEPFVDRMVKYADCGVIKLQSDDDPVRLWEDISDTNWYLDHPAPSFSAAAHQRILQHARERGIIVLLTGQGADEQLGGYNKFLYFYLQDQLRRGHLTRAGSMLGGCLWNGTIVPEFTLANAKRYIPFLRKRFSRDWVGPEVANCRLLDTGLGRSYEEREWRDLRAYSLPALLTYEDRLSMSNSTEMRTPFLDYRLVEALGKVPPGQKLTKGWSKYIFRKAMQDLLPPEIAWRKDKKGYSLPGHIWMKTLLRSRIETTLSQALLASELDLIDLQGARALFADFLAGRTGVRYQDVLSIISLEAWLRRFSPYIEGVAEL